MNAREVKRYRKKLGLSVAKFAERLGVSWSAVYRWERGDVTPEKPTAKLIRMLVREKDAA